MQFVKTNGWDKGIRELTKRLSGELASGKRVLWLVCGGSNIPAAVRVMKALPREDTKNLTIFLTDERYGEVGHINSNAKQLHDAGFQPKDAVFVAMLNPGFSMEETQERYAQALERAVDHADIVIGQFGIGADGHIAGILPHSLAVNALGWIVGYEAPHYMRVTLTFEALRHVKTAYAMVFGEDKKDALTKLRDESIELAKQPSQILKELSEAYVYNDQIGEA